MSNKKKISALILTFCMMIGIIFIDYFDATSYAISTNTINLEGIGNSAKSKIVTKRKLTKDTANLVDKPSDADKYKPKIKTINKDFSFPTSVDDIKKAITTGYPKGENELIIKIDKDTPKNPNKLPDGFTQGEHNVRVTIIYPDKSTNKATVKVIVAKFTRTLQVLVYTPYEDDDFLIIKSDNGNIIHIKVSNAKGVKKNINYVIANGTNQEISLDDYKLQKGDKVKVHVTNNDAKSSDGVTYIVD